MIKDTVKLSAYDEIEALILAAASIASLWLCLVGVIE